MHEADQQREHLRSVDLARRCTEQAHRRATESLWWRPATADGAAGGIREAHTGRHQGSRAGAAQGDPERQGAVMAEYLTPIANHLWQSTLCVGVAALLALALRRNRASVRCWVWITASVKFLVPFSLLTGIGAHLEWPAAAPIDPRPVASVVQDFSYPFTVSDVPSAATAALPRSPDVASSVLPLLLCAVWLGG